MSEGAKVLRKKLEHFRPRIICFNGKGVFIPFVASFDRQLSKDLDKKMNFGKQNINIPGMQDTIVFCMPSTSGRVVGYQKADKKKLFEELKTLYDSLCSGSTQMITPKSPFPAVGSGALDLARSSCRPVTPPPSLSCRVSVSLNRSRGCSCQLSAS